MAKKYKKSPPRLTRIWNNLDFGFCHFSANLLAEMAYSLFDIAGPVMIGPSSSHTAGAVKIGQFARAVFDRTPKKVTFYMHGSFATVTAGHATDKALMAGIMKFKTSDPLIKDALNIAKKLGIEYKFAKTDLGPEYHPNTVKIVLEAPGKKSMEVIGSSIGGGSARIVKINDFDVDIKAIAGKYKYLVISHSNDSAVLTEVLQKITKFDKYYIAGIQSAHIDNHSLTILNLEGRDLTLKEVIELTKIKGVEFVRSLTKLD
ncbi:MAG: L-serine ammonia-lyase, iron-sulfur-dependent subunit beta [Candidatus Gracilibacteria bacterium]